MKSPCLHGAGAARATYDVLGKYGLINLARWILIAVVNWGKVVDIALRQKLRR